ncbi:hypothetical protein OB955_08510 [Halobacteria archaeon AArc-m2/3/4]|uniref:DUF2795 domain-containing protein n=1 Tax=Natronoglomus mannanivorans TaxID=2979990 RepID=A0ABT2QCY6_9EURY|nr:hypothetical protein [Halobacteria archaeon AArc-m2/3/4]
MADDKKGRNKQADDEERRQRKRELEEARERGDEAEPEPDPDPDPDELEPVHDDPGERLGELDEALEEQEYPTTTEDLIEAHGDREVESQEGWKSVDDVLAPVDDETYDSADEVRSRIQGLIRRG